MKKITFLLFAIICSAVSAQVTVNFVVDANSAVYPDATFTNMVLNGNFAPGEEWWGWGVELTDPDMDGVYTGSRVIASNFDYEFVLAGTGAGDGWSGWGVQSGYNAATCSGAGDNYTFSTVDSDLEIVLSILPSIDGDGYWGGCMTVNTLSVEDFEVNEFDVFPNPTQNVWNLNTNNQTINSIQVYDVLGKQVLSLEPKAQDAIIDATSLKSGLYIARINSDSQTQAIRLVKK